ncbi:MAG: hypothetical protein M0C28_20235 [Candidatus Moduliflexus flocculans]|nr:hypothetical protein [Candidatus Moduliflexus flocculans]
MRGPSPLSERLAEVRHRPGDRLHGVLPGCRRPLGDDARPGSPRKATCSLRRPRRHRERRPAGLGRRGPGGRNARRRRGRRQHVVRGRRGPFPLEADRGRFHRQRPGRVRRRGRRAAPQDRLDGPRLDGRRIRPRQRRRPRRRADLAPVPERSWARRRKRDGSPAPAPTRSGWSAAETRSSCRRRRSAGPTASR